MENYTTVWETFELPSKGKIYDKEINPKISLRSMTTAEEMKRLSPGDTPYKNMSDIIEACMQEKPDIHVYDMSIADYQFLMHKLRIVTYGTDYKMTIKCPKCGAVQEVITNLEDLELHEWTPEVIDAMRITLPVTKHVIDLKFQTPRDLDYIDYKSKEMKKKTKQNIDYSIMYTLICLISKVDGAEMNPLILEEFVKQLPTKDANYIFYKMAELNKKVGLDNKLTVKCSECGCDINTTFRTTTEFFGPTIY